MTTPPHLQPLPFGVVLQLSRHAHNVASILRSVMEENLTFTATQTPHDAGRVVKALGFLIIEAQAAKAAFEMAAQLASQPEGD